MVLSTDFIYTGLLNAALIMSALALIFIAHFDQPPMIPKNQEGGDFYESDDRTMSKVISQMSRGFSLIRLMLLLGMASTFWYALGIYTYSQTSDIFNQDLGFLYIGIGTAHIVVFVVYWIIYSAAFIKQKVADFRPA